MHVKCTTNSIIFMVITISISYTVHVLYYAAETIISELHLVKALAIISIANSAETLSRNMASEGSTSVFVHQVVNHYIAHMYTYQLTHIFSSDRFHERSTVAMLHKFIKESFAQLLLQAFLFTKSRTL